MLHGLKQQKLTGQYLATFTHIYTKNGSQITKTAWEFKYNQGVLFVFTHLHFVYLFSLSFMLLLLKKIKSNPSIRFHPFLWSKAASSWAQRQTQRAVWTTALSVSVLLSPLQITVTLILFVRLMCFFFFNVFTSSVMLAWLISHWSWGKGWPQFFNVVSCLMK